MKRFPKETKESSSAYVYRSLYHNIITLGLLPGSSISETSIAEELAVSRTPVREAISTLKNQLLVHSIPQQSTVIAPITIQYVREGYLYRALLEPHIFADLKCNVSKTIATSLEDNLEQQEQALYNNDLDAFYTLDDAFHKILFFASRKENLWLMRKTITGHFDRVRFLVLSQQKIPMAAVLEEHKQLFTYLLTGIEVDISRFYTQHFGGYQEYIPTLQQEFPQYFSHERS